MISLPKEIYIDTNRFDQFDAIARELIDEWQRRKRSAEIASPAESAAGYLKRECYRIIIHYLTQERARLFEEVVRRDGRALTSRVKLCENPFHFGLLALFSGDDVISKQDRSTFATQMLYAYHHSVPPRLLIGFIYQAGPKNEIKRKLIAKSIEPGFESVYKSNIQDVTIRPLH